jgi:hypothetical protein
MVWAKGQSGNPSGRPKETQEISRLRALARGACPDAIKLAQLLVKHAIESIEELERAKADGDWDRAKVAISYDYKSAMQAVQFLADRGMGRTPVAVELGAGEDSQLVIEVRTLAQLASGQTVDSEKGAPISGGQTGAEDDD